MSDGPKILPILVDGDERLRIVAPKYATLARPSSRYANPMEVLELAESMRMTLEASGGIGLAAPQVGESIRLIVVYENGDPHGAMRTMLDPVIISRRGTQYEGEGCLSIPGTYARVRRAYEVTVTYSSFMGAGTHIREARGLEAACIQHEIDHLDGVLFTDRVEKEE